MNDIPAESVQKGTVSPIRTELDLSDLDVRAMADRNHTPEETWANSGNHIGVVCSMCHLEWPCPTRRALREMGVF